jgi:hypothetical protein
MTRDEARQTGERLRGMMAKQSYASAPGRIPEDFRTDLNALIDAATGTVTVEEHDRRVTELLNANNALVARERAALAEARRLRDATDVTINALGKAWGEAHRLRAAVQTAARTFDHYADLHRAKGTPDGTEKAETNRLLAVEMRGALRQDAPR